MKLLVVSEGRNELGDAVETSPLVALVRRMIVGDVDFTCERVSDRKVRVHLPKGKAKAYEKRVLGWIRYAINAGFDALVLVVDHDGHAEREAGLQAAQSNDVLSLSRALGVAIRAFDAWMLADEQALSHVFDTNIGRQKSPESISDPKSVCEGLRDRAESELGLSEFYLQVAIAIDLNRLAERCARGFAPFRSRVEELMAN